MTQASVLIKPTLKASCRRSSGFLNRLSGCGAQAVVWDVAFFYTQREKIISDKRVLNLLKTPNRNY